MEHKKEKKEAHDKEVSLDARTYHPATNLLPGENVEPPHTKGYPRDGDEQVTDDNQTAAEHITAPISDISGTNTSTDNANAPNLPIVDQNNSNHPKHLLKKYAPTYELEEYGRNVMLIFNHETFLCDDPRIGTKKDEEALTDTFSKFGFVVQPYMDLRRKILLDTVKKFAEKTDFSTYGCICVAILTHGGDGPGYLQAHDTSYSEHEVLERFNAKKNPTLAAKPIIFLIQACRGRDPAPAVKPGSSADDLEFDRGADCEHYTIPTEADMLIFHSSYIGRASVRSRTNGTWFIQTLCSMIKKHAADYDLETIFRKVKMAVALDAAEWVEDALRVPKQMPVVTSTVIREIHLRSYDPGLLSGLQAEDEVDKAIDSGLESMQISNASSLNEESPSTDSTSASSVQFMPCSCFLEYFDYLKNCLGLYICENSEDLRAQLLLEMAEKEGDGVEHIYMKLRLMETIWGHLKKHPDKFPFDYVYRSCY